jgi:hypothetical protein
MRVLSTLLATESRMAMGVSDSIEAARLLNGG